MYAPQMVLRDRRRPPLDVVGCLCVLVPLIFIRDALDKDLIRIPEIAVTTKLSIGSQLPSVWPKATGKGVPGLLNWSGGFWVPCCCNLWVVVSHFAQHDWGMTVIDSALAARSADISKWYPSIKIKNAVLANSRILIVWFNTLLLTMDILYDACYSLHLVTRISYLSADDTSSQISQTRQSRYDWFNNMHLTMSEVDHKYWIFLFSQWNAHCIDKSFFFSHYFQNYSILNLHLVAIVRNMWFKKI